MNVIDQASQLARQGRLNQAVSLVTAAAQKGDGEALFAIANWRLWGEYGPRDLAQTHQLLERAAEAGYVDATVLRATLVANGTGVPADWAQGRSLLSNIDTKAATAQLQLLADMKLAPDGSPAGELTARQVSTSPQVAVISGFLSSAECTYLMLSASPRLERSTVIDQRGQRIPNPVRTSDGTSFGPAHEDLVVRAINRRIAAATETDVRQGEPLHILRYAPGQQYYPHLDTIAGEKNQRIVTVLLYLNDRFQGGETFFPEVKLTIQPKAGDALIFRNLDAAGRPDPKSKHAGLPVKSGMKWLATRWIRQAHYHPWGLQQDIR